MTITVSSPATPLVARGLVKRYADRLVLDGLDVTATPGRVLAVVGENGSGKSTLLRVLAGLDQPDAGRVRRPGDVGHLAQDLSAGPAETVGTLLEAALEPLHAATGRLELLAGHLDDPACAEEYSRLLEWAVFHDAWDADRRATEAAHRLGLGGVALDRPVSRLSGGQRSRLALAALLTRRPACLLLDEPTNHLDDDAVSYVEAMVKELPGVVVVASHDRVFLDRVADQVLDLDAGHLGTDGRGGRLAGVADGGYSALLAERAAVRRRWERAFTEQQETREHLLRAAAVQARQVAHNRPPRDGDKFIHHFKGANVERTVRRRVRDAERRLELLDREPVPKPPAPLRFEGPLAGGSGGAVRVRDLVVAGRLRVERLDLAPGGRLLVTGANGSGKSTLLKVLAGRLAPAAPVDGEVLVTARRVGYLPQDVTFPDPERSAEQVYAAAADGAVPLRRLGLLHPRDLSRPVGALSLGQGRRLALALLVARTPDLLLLDEPTNHISLALAEELEAALQHSAGTVVVATHDRWLRSRWEGAQLAL